MDPVTKAMLVKYQAVRVDTYVKAAGVESDRHHRISVFETAHGTKLLVVETNGQPVVYQVHDTDLLKPKT